ncbi:MAG TPA: sigma-70 family RNA polymerase sigma factor [Solirubrobacteraceae bacterium]
MAPGRDGRPARRVSGAAGRARLVPNRDRHGAMSQPEAGSATRDMSTEARPLVKARVERPGALRARGRGRPPSSPLEEFEQMYLRNVDVLMGYFARRCGDPQTVADLTSETFVRAVDGFAGFDPRRGSDRAWLFGIAARVFARHCEQSAGGRNAVARLGGHRLLDEDDIEELAERIDAEREGAALMRRCAQLPAVERAAIELVDLDELTPKEAALVLGVSRVAFRKRLSRARSRLRKEHQSNE